MFGENETRETQRFTARLEAERDELLSALEQSRDILCAIMANPQALPYLLGKDIPAAIKAGYGALQRTGVKNAQEGQ